MWLFSRIAVVIQTVTFDAVSIPLYESIESFIYILLRKILFRGYFMLLCFKADNMYTDAHLIVSDRPFW